MTILAGCGLIVIGCVALFSMAVWLLAQANQWDDIERIRDGLRISGDDDWGWEDE